MRDMLRRTLVLILVGSLLLPAWSWGGYLPVIREAPPFTLERSDGRQLSLAELRGKVAVMALVYASCTDACPLITGKLALLQQRLRERKLLGKEVVLLTVTFDPERDSREVLQRYARGFRADPSGWFFLRGTPEETRRLLAAYDVWVRPTPDGEFDHSDRIFLIDQAGRIREIYSQRLFSPESALDDILSLLPARIR